MNRLLIYIKSSSYLLGLPTTKRSRHLPLLGVVLYYGAIKWLDKKNIRYIDNKMPLILRIIRTIAIIALILFFLIDYLRAFFPILHLQIINLNVFSVLLIVYLFPALFTVKKENEGDFKVTLSIIKSLPKEQLSKVLQALEESEQMLIKQRFGLKGGSVPLSMYELAEIYNMDYSDIKNILISVDNKLFAALESNPQVLLPPN